MRALFFVPVIAALTACGGSVNHHDDQKVSAKSASSGEDLTRQEEDVLSQLADASCALGDDATSDVCPSVPSPDLEKQIAAMDAGYLALQSISYLEDRKELRRDLTEKLIRLQSLIFDKKSQSARVAHRVHELTPDLYLLNIDLESQRDEISKTGCRWEGEHLFCPPNTGDMATLEKQMKTLTLIAKIIVRREALLDTVPAPGVKRGDEEHSDQTLIADDFTDRAAAYRDLKMQLWQTEKSELLKAFADDSKAPPAMALQVSFDSNFDTLLPVFALNHMPTDDEIAQIRALFDKITEWRRNAEEYRTLMISKKISSFVLAADQPTHTHDVLRLPLKLDHDQVVSAIKSSPIQKLRDFFSR